MSIDLKTAESILEKIHKVSGDEGLKAFVDSKGEDLTAIKLTSKEMEYLKGGGFWSDIGKAFKSHHVSAQKHYVAKAFRELF